MGGWIFVAWLVWRGESVGTTETRNEKVVDTGIGHRDSRTRTKFVNGWDEIMIAATTKKKRGS
jgi:hypothetical protein